MFGSISLFCYLDRSCDAGWIHSHCNVFAPPFLASLKSKSTFHCSISRICESKDKSEAEYNDEAEDTEATNDNSGKKRAYAETKHGDKTIKIRINKLGATTVQKRIDKCKCDFCHQEFVMAEELRRHITNRPPTCRPPPPSKFMPVDAPSEVTKHPERNWILFRKQAYTRARNMKNYEEWRCITTVYQGCAGGLKISKNRVTQFRPCNIDHHEYNLNSTGTQNCQRIGLVSDFLLYPMPTFSLL